MGRPRPRPRRKWIRRYDYHLRKVKNPCPNSQHSPTSHHIQKIISSIQAPQDPPSASPSEEEDNPDQQPSKETQESEFFSVGEGEREGEEEEEVAKNTTTGGGEEEEEEEINNKNSKKRNRLWSEDDEITIMEGMINYHSNKGTGPYSEIGEFHEFIKNSLNVDASKSQFRNKFRMMKFKYQKNLKKGERNIVFSKPHDLKCFELSKKIWAVGSGGGGVDGNEKRRSKRVRKTVKLDEKAWGNEVDGNGNLQRSKRAKKTVELDQKSGGSWGMHPCLREAKTLPFDLSMKAEELKKKEKDLLADEVAMHLRLVELGKERTELTELMLDALKGSKD